MLADHYQDGEMGIDNAFGHAWWKAGEAEVITADASPMGTSASGVSPAMLFRVREYSGGADDDHVEVDVYYGFGVARDDGRIGPVWDGHDRWSILRESLEAPEAGAYSLDQPRYFDDHAYVAGGVLVARFEDALSGPPAARLEGRGRFSRATFPRKNRESRASRRGETGISS